MAYEWVRVGAKCTLISAQTLGGGHTALAKLPAFGQTLTVRSTFINPIDDLELCLRFEEVDNRHIAHLYVCAEPGFAVDYFRPVIDQSTDIAMFKSLLLPVDAIDLEEAKLNEFQL